MEVRSDLKIQLSDLHYMWPHVSLPSKGLHELNATQEAEEEEVYHPLTCVASPQVIINTDMRKKTEAWLRDLAPAARGSQDAEYRNLRNLLSRVCISTPEHFLMKLATRLHFCTVP